MNGIVSGKIEKEVGTLNFKIIKSWQVPDSESYWFKDTPSFQQSEYVKIITVTNDKDK